MEDNTKIERLMLALVNGDELTAKQAVQRFGFASTHSVRAAISDLRMRYGIAVYCNEHRDTKGRVTRKYRVGRPTRAVVAAGYRALAAEKYLYTLIAA